MITQNPLITEKSYNDSKEPLHYFKEFPAPGARNRIEVNLVKLNFYLKNKQQIKFRLLRKPEYLIEGEVVEIKEDTHKSPKEYIKMKLATGSEFLINVDEIDSNTIFPSDYDPIKLFSRVQLSEELRKQVFERDDYVCQLKLDGCSRRATEVDHIIPVSKGGMNNLENIQSACMNCNRKKSNEVYA
jgi:hypothetical protein